MPEFKEIMLATRNELFDSNGELYGPTHSCLRNIASSIQTSQITAKHAYTLVKMKRHINIIDEVPLSESAFCSSDDDVSKSQPKNLETLIKF